MSFELLIDAIQICHWKYDLLLTSFQIRLPFSFEIRSMNIIEILFDRFLKDGLVMEILWHHFYQLQNFK